MKLSAPGGEVAEAATACSATDRLLGLAFRTELPDHAVLFPRCRSVQTFGMRVPIDVAFLAWPLAGGESRARVLDVREGVRPFRIVGLPRRERPAGQPRSGISALELAAGRARELGIAPGAELTVEPLPAR